jgi:ferredoxin-NADP reductase
MSKVYYTTIDGRTKIAENTWEVSFKYPLNFSFQAGQYIQVEVPQLLYPDSKGSSRLFSIASSPIDQKKVSIAFRDTGSGFKRSLKELPLGSPINIEGPHGFITLPQNSIYPLVLIAGGIGITPYMSMIRYYSERSFTFPITLLYANRNKESAAYLSELQDLANRNKNFILKPKFGRIDEQFILQNTKKTGIEKYLWYVVGPPLMVEDIKNRLIIMGINPLRILEESYTGY